MKNRIFILRTPGMGPRGPDPLGCLFRLLGLAGLVVLAMFVLLPLVGLGFFIGLGVVAIGAAVVLYYRLRAWLRRVLGRTGQKPGLVGDTYKAEVLDDQTDDGDHPGNGGAAADRPRISVEVRRRPHRD
jgi:hypothetical protein